VQPDAASDVAINGFAKNANAHSFRTAIRIYKEFLREKWQNSMASKQSIS